MVRGRVGARVQGDHDLVRRTLGETEHPVSDRTRRLSRDTHRLAPRIYMVTCCLERTLTTIRCRGQGRPTSLCSRARASCCRDDSLACAADVISPSMTPYCAATKSQRHNCGSATETKPRGSCRYVVYSANVQRSFAVLRVHYVFDTQPSESTVCSPASRKFKVRPTRGTV